MKKQIQWLLIFLCAVFCTATSSLAQDCDDFDLQVSVLPTCSGSNLRIKNYTDTSAAPIAFSWNLAGANITGFLPDTSITTPGLYSLSIAATNTRNGCTERDTQLLTIQSLPSPTFSISDLCFGGIITLINTTQHNISLNDVHWITESGLLWDDTLHFQALKDSTMITLRVTDMIGCTGSLSDTLIFEYVGVSINGDDTACVGSAQRYTAQYFPDSANLSWYVNSKLQTEQSDTFGLLHQTAESVLIEVRASLGPCADNSERLVKVIDTHKPSFVVQDVCVGDSSICYITSPEPGPYLLNWGDGTVDSSHHTNKHLYQLNNWGETESFLVGVSLARNGKCLSPFHKTTTVNGLPDASFTFYSSGSKLTCEPVTNDPTYFYQWRMNDGQKSNEMSPTFELLDPQFPLILDLTLIDANGCDAQHSEYVHFWGGITESDRRKSRVFPNPASNILTVEQYTSGSTYRIVSVQGIELAQGILHTGLNQLDISQLSNSSYFIHVTSKEASSVHPFYKSP